jgi:hypothetical protein
MFLPPSNNQNNAPAQPQQGHLESRKLRLLRSLYKWSALGFCFCAGVGLASLTRLIPATRILYWVAVVSVSGYLVLDKPENATEETMSMRRICGFALALSVLSFWDVAKALVTMPINFGVPFIGEFILPAWLVVVCGLLFVVGAFLTFWSGKQGGRS